MITPDSSSAFAKELHKRLIDNVKEYMEKKRERIDVSDNAKKLKSSWIYYVNPNKTDHFFFFKVYYVILEAGKLKGISINLIKQDKISFRRIVCKILHEMEHCS